MHHNPPQFFFITGHNVGGFEECIISTQLSSTNIASMKRNVDLLPDKIGVAAGNIRGLFQPREETSANESSGQQTNCL